MADSEVFTKPPQAKYNTLLNGKVLFYRRYKTFRYYFIFDGISNQHFVNGEVLSRKPYG